MATAGGPLLQYAGRVHSAEEAPFSSSAERELLAVAMGLALVPAGIGGQEQRGRAEVGTVSPTATSREEGGGEITRVTVLTDSLAAAGCIRKGYGSSFGTGRVMAVISRVAWARRLQLVPVWLKRVALKRPDLLSRIHASCFRIP